MADETVDTEEIDSAGLDDAVDEEEYVDALPDDLNAVDFVGPYLFPNNSKRRIPGILYLAIGGVLLVLWFVGTADDSPLMNGGVALGALALVVVGLYHLQGGWDLAVDEQDALVEATKAVGFPVGHASAQMAWRGLRSRPTWRILLYSNEAPPEQRGFAMVDGVDGEVVHVLTEPNPEDWSAFESAT